MSSFGSRDGAARLTPKDRKSLAPSRLNGAPSSRYSGQTVSGSSTEGGHQDRGATARVSIGLPVYNGEDFLEEALDSLLGQTYGDFELIISDNASTDRTQEICERYASSDPRIRYRRNAENIGPIENSNLTFQIARTEYFRFAAHDDRCAPTMLERLVEEMDRHPEVVNCYSASVLIDADGRQTGFSYRNDAFVGRPRRRLGRPAKASLR